MKKKLFLLVLLLLIFNVNAEMKTINQKNYFFEEINSCGFNNAYAYMRIDDTRVIFNNLDSVDENDGSKIYEYGKGCRDVTLQDKLDLFNSKETYIMDDFDYEEELVRIIQKTLITGYEYFYVKNVDNYNENESYYELIDNDFYYLFDVNESNVNEYYVQEIFKKPTSAEIDKNQTYYKMCNDVLDCIEKYDGNFTDVKVTELFVKTTEEEVITRNEITTFHYEDYYNIFGYIALPVYFNNTLYIILPEYNDDAEIISTKVYDKDLKEITELKNYKIDVYGNYAVFNSLDKKIDYIYDSDMNLIATYENTDKYYYHYVQSGDSLYINKYNFDTFESGNTTNVIRYIKVLDGDKQTYNGKDLTFRFNVPFSLFKELKINGNVIDKSLYTVKEGSTIVSLTSDYISTLEKGEYTVTAVFSDGSEANTQFTKTTSLNIPISETIDMVSIYGVVLILSVVGLMLPIIGSRKKTAKEM